MRTKPTYDYRETLTGMELANALACISDAAHRNVYVVTKGRTYRVVGIDTSDMAIPSIDIEIEELP